MINKIFLIIIFLGLSLNLQAIKVKKKVVLTKVSGIVLNNFYVKKSNKAKKIAVKVNLDGNPYIFYGIVKTKFNFSKKATVGVSWKLIKGKGFEKRISYKDKIFSNFKINKNSNLKNKKIIIKGNKKAFSRIIAKLNKNKYKPSLNLQAIKVKKKVVLTKVSGIVLNNFYVKKSNKAKKIAVKVNLDGNPYIFYGIVKTKFNFSKKATVGVSWKLIKGKGFEKRISYKDKIFSNFKINKNSNLKNKKIIIKGNKKAFSEIKKLIAKLNKNKNKPIKLKSLANSKNKGNNNVKSLIAEWQFYGGVGFNSFTISTKAARDSGSTIGLSGGVILGDKTRVNVNYYSGKDGKSKVFTSTVFGVSYNYSFNNQGIHQGWYVGGGLAMTTLKIDETSKLKGKDSSNFGLLLRGGYAYKTSNNLLLDIGFNYPIGSQTLKLEPKGGYVSKSGADSLDLKASTSAITISANYLF